MADRHDEITKVNSTQEASEETRSKEKEFKFWKPKPGEQYTIRLLNTPSAKFYMLVGHHAIPVTQRMWSAWRAAPGVDERCVVDSCVILDYQVSTVFIGINTGAPLGKVEIFETLVQSRGNDFLKIHLWRRGAATWDEAVTVHNNTVAAIYAGVMAQAQKNMDRWAESLADLLDEAIEEAICWNGDRWEQ